MKDRNVIFDNVQAKQGYKSHLRKLFLYNEHPALSLGLTYDDVLMQPKYSEVGPGDVSLVSRATRGIKFKKPIWSAAMDKVTSYDMAIEMAKEGGLGVIHKNMSVEDQSEAVRKVKRAASGVIHNPVFVRISATVGEVLDLMDKNNIGGAPVVLKDGETLAGIVTRKDLKYEEDKDICIENMITGLDKLEKVKASEVLKDKMVDIEKVKAIFKEKKVDKLPVEDENGKLIALITRKDIEKIEQNPDATKDKYGRLCVAAAVGVGKKGEDRALELLRSGVDILVVDSAHGHSKNIIDMVKYLVSLKDEFSYLQIVAGNISTAEAAVALYNAGVDAVKVGIGPGSICTTRRVTGVGTPQLSAVMRVYSGLKAHRIDIPVIADGGISESGHIALALAAGADSVMLGSMLAGTDESPGIVNEDGVGNKVSKDYRGMGSKEAMSETFNSRDRYGQGDVYDLNKIVPEGVSGTVPYVGSVSSKLFLLCGGVRAAISYHGVTRIDAFREEVSLMQITSAGLAESKPHHLMK
jgi:IMP dehydrogenase